MSPLIRKTLSLCRRQPVFWIPLLVTTLALIGLDSLRQIFRLRVVQWLMLSNTSALSSTSEHQVTSSAYRKALVIGAPLEWGSVVVGLFLHLLALVVTAALVRSFLNGKAVGLHHAFQDALARKRPALCLSLKVFPIMQFFEPLALFLLSLIPPIATAIRIHAGLLAG
jgi:hypothetical protein